MNGNDDLYVPNSNVNEANSNVDNSWTDNDNNGRAWVRVKTLLHTFAPAANLAPQTKPIICIIFEISAGMIFRKLYLKKGLVC